MRFKIYILLILTVFLSSILLASDDYKTVVMKKPSDITVFDLVSYETAIGDNDEGVFIGAIPDNFNGIYLGCQPGFTQHFNVRYLISFELYERFYNLGYAVAFFANSGLKGDFFNAQSIAKGLDKVTEHYGVDKIDLTGWSNGGVAIELAMTKYEKADKINRVYTLGTPFYGTPNADLFNILPDFIQYALLRTSIPLLSLIYGSTPSGTDVDTDSVLFTSQAYRTQILRPYVDNHKLNRPEDFVIGLSKDFFNLNDFHHIEYDVAMALSGTLLSILTLSTENDGVTPYPSGLRPGAVLYDEFADLDHHHIDLVFGEQFTVTSVDQMIKRDRLNPYSRRSNLRQNKTDLNSDKSRNMEIISNYQISSLGFLKVDKNSISEPKLISFEKEEIDSLNNLESTPKNRMLSITNSTDDSKKKRTNKNKFKNIFIKKYIAPNTFNNNRTSSNNVNELSFLVQEEIKAKLLIDFSQSIFSETINPYPTLILDIESEQDIALKSVDVSAYAKRKGTLLGKLLDEEFFEINFKFNEESEKYEASTILQKDGIYDLRITLENEDFKRHLIGSYTVGSFFEEDYFENEEALNSKSNSKLLLDATKNKIFVMSNDNVNTESKCVVSVFNSIGRFVGKFKAAFSDLNSGVSLDKVSISLNRNSLYFVSINHQGGEANFKAYFK